MKVLRTPDSQFEALPGWNFAPHYTTIQADDGTDTALTTIDDTKRGFMLAAATEKAVGELAGVIPLHYEVSTWGVKKGLAYRARVDQYTLAHEVRPAK